MSTEVFKNQDAARLWKAKKRKFDQIVSGFSVFPSVLSVFMIFPKFSSSFPMVTQRFFLHVGKTWTSYLLTLGKLGENREDFGKTRKTWENLEKLLKKGQGDEPCKKHNLKKLFKRLKLHQMSSFRNSIIFSLKFYEITR